MIRLFKVEWFKLSHYRPFWILIGLYGLGICIVAISPRYLFDYLKKRGLDFDGIDPTIIPLYDFPDIWQNLTFATTIFKVILGFIIVINIANEARFRTLRQNVIDGFSKGEFLASKLLLNLGLALASTLLVFLLGLILGSIYSHPMGKPYMFHSTGFLLAHTLAIFTYLCFAQLLTLLIPKPGLVIIGLLMYTIIFEPVLSTILWNGRDFSDWVRLVPDFLPVTSLNNLIHLPYGRYAFFEIQDYVALDSIAIVLAWAGTYIGLSYLLLRWKDW